MKTGVFKSDVTGETEEERVVDNLAAEYAKNIMEKHKTAATIDHPDGSVETEKIADGAVTKEKIADDVLPNIKKNPASPKGDIIDTHLTVGVRVGVAGWNSFVSGGSEVNYDDGEGNEASGENSFAGGGTLNKASGLNSFIGGGKYHKASGQKTFIGGGDNHEAIGDDSFIGGGCDNTTDGGNSFIGGGFWNTTEGGNSFIGGGYRHITKGGSSFIGGGRYHSTPGMDSFIGGGRFNNALDFQVKFGRYAKDGTQGSATGKTGDAVTVGNGDSENTRSNAFRVTYGGETYGLSSFNSTGADYAEVWEWVDGNPDNEDRVGKFVAFEGEKVRLATANDPKEILGIVSAVPAVVGDNYADNWHGMYLKDKFGRYLTEHKKYEAKYEEVTEIDPVTQEEKTVQKLVCEAYETDEYILNPDYDPSQEYIPRLERAEFDAVGTHGKLVVTDDGTCQVGGFCMPGENGIATKADSGFYVMKRIDETTIKVYLK